MTAGDSTAATDPWPLGDELRAARKRANYSLRAAAERAGFSPATWDALEKGYRGVGGGQRVQARNPDAKTVARAAEVVGLNPATLLAHVGLELAVDGVSGAGRPTVAVRALAEDVERLDEPERRVIRDMVDVILRAKGLIPADEPEPAAAVPPAEPVHSGPRRGAFDPVRSDEEGRSVQPRPSS